MDWNGVSKILGLFVFLQFNISTTFAGQLCFSCQNLPHPWDCNKVVECAGNEKCFVESFVTSIGTTIFNSGCKSSSRCTSKRSSSDELLDVEFRQIGEVEIGVEADGRVVKREDIPVCDQCCGSDLCNREICDFTHPSIPLANLTTCFSCDDVLDPKDCQYITYCNEDDVCFTEVMNVNGENRYRLGCVRRDACRDELQPTTVFGKRQLSSEDDPDLTAYCAKCCRTSGMGGCNRELCGTIQPAFKQQELYFPPYRRDCNDVDVRACAQWNALEFQVCTRNRSIYNYACREYCKTCVNPGHIAAPSGFLLPASDCFYESTRYEGKYDTTIHNKKCIKWSQVIDSADALAQDLPDSSLEITGSKCRDPDGRGHPWCFTSIQREWEYCPVPFCQQCYYKNTSQSFDGKISVDLFGTTCDFWTTTNLPDSSFPGSNKTASRNYCRDPEKQGFTYCFKNSEPAKCDVPECTVPCKDDPQTDCNLIKAIACRFDYISLTLCPKTCRNCSMGLLPAIPAQPPADNCTDNVKANCPLLKDYICNDPEGAKQYCPKTCRLCGTINSTIQPTVQTTTAGTAGTETTTPKHTTPLQSTTHQHSQHTTQTTMAAQTTTEAPGEWMSWGPWVCQDINGVCVEVRNRNCSKTKINENGTTDTAILCGSTYYNIILCSEARCPEYFTTTATPSTTASATKPPCNDDPKTDCDNVELLDVLCKLPGAAALCQRSCGMCPDQTGAIGAVTGSVSRPECYTFHGGILTKDGYTWYELQNVHGGNGLVAGTYLNIGSASDCTGGSSSSGSGSCSDATAKDYACRLLQLADAGTITLWKQHPSGVHDNAYAYNNIRDTCHGQAASRSHYTCSECSSPGAPGGHVCLKGSLLKYIWDVHQRLGAIHVNEIAGACHSCTSKHYQGGAVDLHNPTAAQSSTMLSMCFDHGGWGQNEGDHIHCQFTA